MVVHYSLAYLKADGATLRLYCEEPPKPGEDPCRHAADGDWDTLIAKFGADFVIPDNHAHFISKLRCAKCGGKTVSITLHPGKEPGRY